MGDTSVDFFLETLKQLITSSKLDSIINEKPQLQSLEEDIKHLRGFLKVTEKKRDEHSEVMNLVIEIREVVSDAENIVERFVIDAFKADHLSLELESVKNKIQTFMAMVMQIYDKNIYDINGVAIKKHKHSSTRSGGVSSSVGGSNASKVVKEKVVVGFDKEVVRLIEKLDEGGESRRLEIISIIGAGGGGKTTLAREAYDHLFTSHVFQIRAWLEISQDYGKTTAKRDLLIRILESVFPENHEDYEKSSDDILGERVYRCLKGRKYLIVMDDIWGIEAWNDIRRSYPNERKGSKVVFTTRRLVQPDCVNFVPLYLDPLPKHQSWELLQKKVFGMNCCPPELVNIGEKIAEKCEGLPLAIVAIAGILATEDKTPDVWEEVAKHLSSIIAENQEVGCMEILELSYNHLPLHLKACFLYVGAFLEDYEIRVRELLWLWIAEGFIPQSEGGKSLESTAKDYLVDLIDRSLVMVARKSSIGEIKACRIHDLLRVFCLKKAEEDNFLVQYKDGSFSHSTPNKHRRLFIGSNFFQQFSLRPRAGNIHSLLCLDMPNSSYLPFEQNLSFFAETFARLRVLSFISTECRGDIGIGHLVHLRYLAVRIPRQMRFFASRLVSNLLNLETLNLQVSERFKIIRLPGDIFKMVKLRHLYSKQGVFEYHCSSVGEGGIGFDQYSNLDSLQTLHQICACKDCRSFLVRTPNLRKLGLTKTVNLRDGSFMVPDLEFLECLETLSLAVINMIGMKLPLTVTRLTLLGTRLKWEELSILQNLPRLRALKFDSDACEGPIWNAFEQGFSQLRYLSINEVDIEEWNASEDLFPTLEALELKNCEKLKQIPIDFGNLNELCQITLEWCSRSAEESAREIQKKQKNRKGPDDCLNLIIKSNEWNDD